MIKKISILIAMFGILLTQIAHAQTFKHKLLNSPDKTVKFVIPNSPITIKGYDGNQLIIKSKNYNPADYQFGNSKRSRKISQRYRAAIEQYREAIRRQKRHYQENRQKKSSERAKGLHPVYSNNSENNEMGLSISKENGMLVVSKTAFIPSKAYIIKVPNKVNIKVKGGFNSREIKISNQKGEIEIDAQMANIKLTNVTGPVIASVSYGNINVVFSHLSDASPSSITTLNGYIDVTLPASANVDLRMRSMMGRIYTDFDIHKKKSEQTSSVVGAVSPEIILRNHRIHRVSTSLKGGGVELKLATSHGSIYLRKG